MSDNKNDNKDWKAKFFKISDTLERQQNYDQVLEKSLSRLALVAEGLDPKLDNHLKSLRKILRSKRHEMDDVEQILSKIERSISSLDDEKVRQDSSINSLLVSLVRKIQWPDKYKKAADSLIKNADKTSQDDISDLFDELATLIERCFNTEGQAKSSSFLSKFFERENDVSETAAEVEDLELSTQAKPSNEYGILQEVLLQLLEKLTISFDIGSYSESLRNKIQQQDYQDRLSEIIDDFALVISKPIFNAIEEKKGFESFLKTLAGKVDSLTQHIVEISEYDKTSYQQQHNLVGTIENEVNSVRDEVDIATDLAELKLSLRDHLEKLHQNVSDFYEADSQRFEHSQQQIALLTQRVQEMEAETESLKQSSKEARDLARKDPLTRIWNRYALDEFLEQEYQKWSVSHGYLTLVIWDVDFFKKVNDQYGHSAGDIVLKSMAKIIDQTIGEDAYLARFGGEEFVGLFPGKAVDEAIQVAEIIRKKIEKVRFQHSGNTLNITVSAGLASFELGDTVETVFQRADDALYLAKERGRNNCQIKKR